MNYELPDIQAGFRKGRGTRDQIATFIGSLKKQESSRKTSISALLTTPKPLTVWITINCGKFWEMGIRDHLTCFLRNLYAIQEATRRYLRIKKHSTDSLMEIERRKILKKLKKSKEIKDMLSRLVITFLPRNKHLLSSWLQSPSAMILEPPKIKSDTVSTVFPSISYGDRIRCHDLSFLNVKL